MALAEGLHQPLGPPDPNLANTDIAAVCVHAIWIARAASISFSGAAASIIASAAFMAVSEIPPQCSRAACCNWNIAAFAKSLDISRRIQSSGSPNM
jgi:hypothetical protein